MNEVPAGAVAGSQLSEIESCWYLKAAYQRVHLNYISRSSQLCLALFRQPFLPCLHPRKCLLLLGFMDDWHLAVQLKVVYFWTGRVCSWLAFSILYGFTDFILHTFDKLILLYDFRISYVGRMVM